MIWMIVIGIVVFDLGMATLIVWALVRGNWHPLIRAFPATTPSEDALERKFQSFRLGVMNLGFCIHVAVDESHLHLTPVKFLRWLSMRPLSIPWEAIELREQRAGGRMREARVLRKHLLGPSWCLDLADPAQVDVQSSHTQNLQ